MILFSENCSLWVVVVSPPLHCWVVPLGFLLLWVVLLLLSSFGRCCFLPATPPKGSRGKPHQPKGRRGESTTKKRREGSSTTQKVWVEHRPHLQMGERGQQHHPKEGELNAAPSKGSEGRLPPSFGLWCVLSLAAFSSFFWRCCPSFPSLLSSSFCGWCCFCPEPFGWCCPPFPRGWCCFPPLPCWVVLFSPLSSFRGGAALTSSFWSCCFAKKKNAAPDQKGGRRKHHYPTGRGGAITSTELNQTSLNQSKLRLVVFSSLS